MNDDVSPSIEDVLSKTGPAAEAIKNLLIERDQEIKKLTEDKQRLLEEIRQLKERADRKVSISLLCRYYQYQCRD